jgi:hypothetical protein
MSKPEVFHIKSTNEWVFRKVSLRSIKTEQQGDHRMSKPEAFHIKSTNEWVFRKVTLPSIKTEQETNTTTESVSREGTDRKANS